MRYYVQCGDDCVPLALLNALKWQGRIRDKRLLPAIKRTVRYRPKEGTVSWWTVDGVRKYFGKRIKTHYSPKLAELDAALDSGHGAIISTSKRLGKDGHCFLIIARTAKSYKAVNYWKDSQESWLRRKTILNELRPRFWQSQAWYINGCRPRRISRS